MRSDEPTPFPTAQPTAPSALPTAKPTFWPSAQPTTQPTLAPSADPTARPTLNPSAQPTPQPTTSPSSVPSVRPSPQPTLFPTAQPTVPPTLKPSALPTTLPTLEPSALPTVRPTQHPSAQPTNAPSSAPTTRPSPEPTFAPSAMPSFLPTGIPTGLPTGQPTGRPSTSPTLHPSVGPTSKAHVSASSPQEADALSQAVTGGKNSFYFYTAIAAAGFLCCIAAGLYRFYGNVKKKRSAYEQWIEYEDAMREGRQVRANTNVREPPKPSALHKDVHHGLELRDAIPAALLPPARLQLFQADMRSETSAVQAPKSASLTPIEEFYGSRGQVRQLDHREDEDEDEEEGGDAFTGDLPGHQSRSPNKQVSAPKAPKGKSASVFGSFNPLVVGADPAQRLREEDARMTREQSMLRPTDGSRLQGGVGGIHAFGGTVSNPLSHSMQQQHRSADLRVLTSPLPPGLSSPVQSPELIEALDSVNLDAVPFEDSEDDEEGEGGLGIIAEDEDEDEDDEGYEDAQSSVDNSKV